MSVGGHGRQTTAKGIHTPFAWTFADATARTSFSPTEGEPMLLAQLTTDDIGRVGLQLDDNTLWRLTAVTPTWVQIAGASLGGDVVGPGSATDNAVARFDGTTGKLIQNSVVTISDTGALDGVHSADLDILTGGGKPSHAEARLFYDGDEHTLALYNDEVDVTHQLGQEGLIRVYNNSGATILNGKPVYVTGSDGTEFRPTIALAQANTEATADLIGVTTHDIENNTFGYVTAWGLVNGVDTSAFSVGEDIYLSASVAGGYSTIPPVSSGSYVIRVGFVARSDVSLGRILVSISASSSPSGDANQLVLTVLKDSAGTINPGQVVRLVSYNVGLDRPTVELASASAAGTMPAIGIARDSITNSTAGIVIVSGKMIGQSTASFSVNDALYVSATSGALTNVKPQGTNLVQKIAQCLYSHASNGVIEVVGAGRSNDLPNLAQNYVWAGDSNGVPQQSLHIGAGGSIHAAATTSVAGFMSASDKTKLDAIPAGASGDVQYHNGSGGLGAEAAFTYDSAGDQLTVPGLTMTQDFLITGVISPTQITANQNDYAPTGFSTATVLRLTSDASRNITGLAGGALGRYIIIHNVGSNPIVLVNSSGSSTAANQFLFSADITLQANQSIALRYDGTSSRWRAIAGLGGSSSTTPFRKVYAAYDLLSPYTNWAVNIAAGLAADSTNAALMVRRFDDSTEEGVGWGLTIPTGMTNLTLYFKSRAQTTPGGSVNVVPQLYRRTIPDNSAVGAWSAATVLTSIAFTTNQNFQYDSQTLTLAGLSLTAGTYVQFELTRNGASGSDTLSGDWDLVELVVEFT